MLIFREIKRRKMFQVIAVYGLTAWLIVQVITSIEAPLQLPGWSDTLVIVLLGLGFPVLLVVSWFFNVTPEGFVRDEGAVATRVRLPIHIEWVLLALMATAVLWLLYRTEFTSAPSSGTSPGPYDVPRESAFESIAVLPFDNLSARSEDAYFAAGLHDEILSRLASLQSVRVISRTSVLRYADTEMAIPQIARELNVSSVLEGSVQYADGSVRIRAQLIDAETDQHLWSGTYEEKFENIFAVESNIALSIANALRAEFSQSEQATLTSLPTNSVDAYRAYLGAPPPGRDQLGQSAAPPGMGQPGASQPFLAGPPGGEQSLIRARLDSLRRAIEADPEFAVAYVERAGIYIQALRTPGLAASLFAPGENPEQLALADIEVALEIEPGLGRAYAWLGMIHRYNWRGPEAREAFETAITLSPHDPLVLTNYAYFLSNSSAHDAAIDMAEQALKFDPHNPETRAALALVYAGAGRYADAAETLEVIAPGQSPWVLPLTANYESILGNPEGAETALRHAEPFALSTQAPQWPALVAYNYARLGLDDDAARLLTRLDELSGEQRLPAAAEILASLARGNEDAALNRLADAVETKAPYEAFNLVMSIASNIYRDPVLDQPRFSALRRRLQFMAG